MKTYINTVKLTFLMLLFAAMVQAQDTTSVKTAIESKQFVFKVHSVIPAAGSLRQLSGEEYQVRVSGDSLRSYLPYFGRVYTAPIGREGGIKFTSTQFDYVAKNRRRGGWEVVLRPKDVMDVRELLLTVSDNGTASLRAYTNSRQPITYNGTVNVVGQRQ